MPGSEIWNMWWKVFLVFGAALFFALALALANTTRALDISILDLYFVILPWHLAFIGSSFVLLFLLTWRHRVHH